MTDREEERVLGSRSRRGGVEEGQQQKDSRTLKVDSQSSSEPWTEAGTLNHGTGLSGARFK